VKLADKLSALMKATFPRLRSAAVEAVLFKEGKA
jgi:hypothetical protein